MELDAQHYITTSTIIANPKLNFDFTMFLYWADQENFVMVWVCYNLRDGGYTLYFLNTDES